MRVETVRVATRDDERSRQLRDARNRAIIGSDKTELRRSDLDFGRHWIEHVPTGEFFRVVPDADPTVAGHLPCFYVDALGNAVLLERADPASRDELERRRAARDARRAARDAAMRERRARIRAGKT